MGVRKTKALPLLELKKNMKMGSPPVDRQVRNRGELKNERMGK